MAENEYIWGVSQRSPEDGHTGFVAYFTIKGDADALAKRIGGHAVQTTLWKDGDDYYEVVRRKVLVDVPDREEVLKKLTKRERQALGFN